MSRVQAEENRQTVIVVLSRAVNDERLSKQFLQAAAESTLTGSSAGDAQQGPLE